MKVLVTPHAIETYQERVIPAGISLPPERCEAEIVAAMRRPLFWMPSADATLTLWGCRNAVGFPVTMATDPADANAPFVLVRTCGPWWFWHECRRAWGGKRATLRDCIGAQPCPPQKKEPPSW